MDNTTASTGTTTLNNSHIDNTVHTLGGPFKNYIIHQGGTGQGNACIGLEGSAKILHAYSGGSDSCLCVLSVEATVRIKVMNTINSLGYGRW